MKKSSLFKEISDQLKNYLRSMDWIFALKEYLNYQRQAGSVHDVHSPFVFNLFNTIIRDRTPYYIYERIESLRSGYLLDERGITVMDFGTGGGEKGVSRTMKIQSIARRYLQSGSFAQLLFRMVNHYRPDVILELGTSLGITTMYLAAPHRNSRVITLEGCPATAELARSSFEKMHFKNIELFTGPFSNTLPAILSREKLIDFAYLDGNHRLQATLDYFNFIKPLLHEDSIVVLDDIHWSREMTRAWNLLKNDPGISITIDLYKMGIIFFRKGITRQHFTLRY
ncbi:MAG: class I SAM-dependent methyltransferase [Bacteroidia bacterium]|nr:class I SAM-dependent methyltransferase [Bacteroidia bacterium]